MSITDLIRLTGEENLPCQWIHDSSADWQLAAKKGYARCCFATAPENMPSLDGTARRVGIVLWFTQEVLEKVKPGPEKARA